MKQKMQEKIIIKPFNECLDLISEDTFDELYEETMSMNEALKKLKKPKMTKKQKKEYIKGYILAKYLTFIMFSSEEELSKLEKLISTKTITDDTLQMLKMLINERLIFKVENGFCFPEDLKKVNKDTKNLNLKEDKTSILTTYYMLTNGVLEVSKLVDLITKSGFKTTEKEIIEISRTNGYKLDKDVIYFDNFAVESNKNNELLKLKNALDYKVVSIDDAINTLVFLEAPQLLAESKTVLRKFFLDDIDLEETLDSMFKMLLLGWNDKQNIDKLLKSKKIKLGKDKEKFDESLIEVSHSMPNWFLNGYSKHEIFCKDDFDMDELEEEEKIILYIVSYVSINGIISIDKLLEILSKEHNFKVSKQTIKKLVKETGFSTIENCVCCIDFEKEDFDSIRSTKTLDQYKIIDDVKKFSDEFEKNNNKLASIFEKYKLDEECAEGLNASILMGIFGDETINEILDTNDKNISSKKRKELIEDLTPILLDTRMWTLNGFTPKEAKQFLIDKLNGKKNLCNCSSSKKNKKCCEK